MPRAVLMLAITASLVGSHRSAMAQTDSTGSASIAGSAGEAPSEESETSRAEASSTEKATKLFEQGRVLVEQAKYAEACATFEESLAIVNGVGTRFNLANCYERLGLKAKAHALFTEIVDATTGEPERHEAASMRALALEPELGVLRIELEDATQQAKVQVSVSGVALSGEALGKRYFIDPGTHVIRVHAPETKTDWSETATVEAGESRLIVVPALTLTRPAPLEAAPAEPEPEPEPEPVEDSSPEDPDVTSDAEPGKGWTWLPPTAIGVGAVGLFVGIAYTQQYRATHEDAQAICPSNYGCTASEIERHDELVEDERRSRSYAAIGYGVAAASLATVVAYYLWTPGEEQQAHARAPTTVAPLLGSDIAGCAVQGRF